MIFKRSDDFAKRGLRTNYVSTIFGISLVLFMIGVVLGSVILLHDVETQFKENLQGDVFFYLPIMMRILNKLNWK